MVGFYTRAKQSVSDVPNNSHRNWTVIIGAIYAGATVAASNLGYTNIKNKDEALAIVGATVITGLLHVGQRISAYHQALKSSLRDDEEGRNCTVVKITGTSKVKVSIKINTEKRE